MAESATGTTKKRTRKPSAPPAAETAATATVAPAATNTQADLPLEQSAGTAASPSERVNLVDQLDIDELFPADGSFPKRGVFRFNEIFGAALALRRAILVKIAKTPHDKIKAMSRPARNTMFGLIRSERKRYYGTALRVMNNDEINAKKGDPLPKLVFKESREGAVSTTIAAGYGRAIRWAGSNLRGAIFPDEAQLAAADEPAEVAA